MPAKKVYTYHSYTDDVVTNSGQDYKLPQDYQWIRRSRWQTFMYALTYKVWTPIANFYRRVVLDGHVVNSEIIKPFRRKGYFVYCNHTLEIGDPLDPISIFKGERVFYVCSPANYGIPVIGGALEHLGALPVPAGVSTMAKFNEAVMERATTGHPIIIYPEAHLWPYYTGVRPFEATSFHYPVKSGLPSFTMTTVFKDKGKGRKPRIEFIFDGPFYPDSTLKPREQKENLRNQIYGSLSRNVKLSNCEAAIYRQIEE